MKRPGINARANEALARMYKRRKRRQRVPHITQPGEYIAEQMLLLENAALYDPPENPTPEDILLAKQRSMMLECMIDALAPREARALRMRCGFDCEPMTLDQIGEQLGGVSRTRINQIIAKACRKLQHPARAQHIHKFYSDIRHGKPVDRHYVPHWRREEIAAQEKAEDENVQRDHERAVRLVKEREAREVRELASRREAENVLRMRGAQERADAERRYLAELNSPQSQRRFREYVAYVYGLAGMLPPGVWR